MGSMSLEWQTRVVLFPFFISVFFESHWQSFAFLIEQLENDRKWGERRGSDMQQRTASWIRTGATAVSSAASVLGMPALPTELNPGGYPFPWESLRQSAVTVVEPQTQAQVCFYRSKSLIWIVGFQLWLDSAKAALGHRFCSWLICTECPESWQSVRFVVWRVPSLLFAEQRPHPHPGPNLDLD